MPNGKLLIEDLILDGGTQPRIEVSDEAIAEYTEWLMENPDRDMPAIHVVKNGDLLWPWDGFHRVYSYRKAGRLSIPAEVHAGTLRDAQLKSKGANSGHGLRRTPADKRKAVNDMLKDKEWATWSDRTIAEHVKVSPTLVGDVRRQMFPPEHPAASTVHVDSSNPAPTRKGRDGKQRPASNPARHRRAPGAPPAPSPTADPVRNAAAERIARQQAASPAGAVLAAPDQHDAADVTPHRCPSCGHRWQGMNEPPLLPKDPLPDFPAGLDTPEFIASWTDWVNYRRERKLPKYTSKGFSLQMRDMLALGVEKAIKAIENSIKQNYNGIIPADGKGSKNGKATERTRHRYDPAVHGSE